MGNRSAVPVCYLPHTEDNYGQHIRKVRDSLIKSSHRTKECHCHKVENKKKLKPLVVVIQSQGRLGDEITSIVTNDFIVQHRVRERHMMLAVIRDDEHTVTDSTVVLDAFPGKDRISVVDIHVVPNQHCLHACRGESNRNKLAKKKIKEWIKGPSRKVEPKEEKH